jgi:hypothetical protein
MDLAVEAESVLMVYGAGLLTMLIQKISLAAGHKEVITLPLGPSDIVM